MSMIVRTSIRKPAFYIMLITAVLLILTACGTKTEKLTLDGYGDIPIEISGLTDSEFTITPIELAQMKLEQRSATGATQKAGTVNATGPALKTLLAEYGKTSDDFRLARFIASDGYRVTLHENGLQNWDVILSVFPLSVSEQPLRLLIPEAESSQWIYAVVRIEFEPAD